MLRGLTGSGDLIDFLLIELKVIFRVSRQKMGEKREYPVSDCASGGPVTVPRTIATLRR